MADVTTIILVSFLLIAVCINILIMGLRYKKVAPDKAMVVYGRRMRPNSTKGFMVISGGGKFIVPVIESYELLDLKLKDVVMDLDHVNTDPAQNMGQVRCTVSVLYKVSSGRHELEIAAETIMGKTEEEVKRIVQVVVEGTLRQVASTWTPQALDHNRQEFERMFGVMAAQDLMSMGLEIRSISLVRLHQKGVV